jgi:hypothetical protein
MIGKPPGRRSIGNPSPMTVPVRRVKSADVSTVPLGWPKDAAHGTAICLGRRAIHSIQRDEAALGVTDGQTDLGIALASLGDRTFNDTISFR